MRSMLSVKWKIILAVVGVSFVCLVCLMLINRYQSEQYMAASSRELLREAAILEASRYNQSAENIATVLGSLSSRILSELDVSRARGTDPDTVRLANFTSALMNEVSSYVHGIGFILSPGVFEHAIEDTRFFNSDDYAVIEYAREGGSIALVPPLPSDEIRNNPIWRDTLGKGKGTIQEPYMATHFLSTGERAAHVETRFVYPVLENDKVIGLVWGEMCLTEYQDALIRSTRAEGLEHRPSVLISPDGVCVGGTDDLRFAHSVANVNGGLPRIDGKRFPELMAALGGRENHSESIDMGEPLGKVYAITATIFREKLDRCWTVMLFQSVRDNQVRARNILSRQYYDALAMLLVSVALGYLVTRMMGRTLISAEEWHRTILDRVPMPLGLVDRESRWIYANPAIADVLEIRDRDALIGKNCRETMPPGDADFIMSTNHPDAAENMTMELPVEGNRVHSVMSCRLLDEDGTYLGRLIIGIDVTDTLRISRTLDLASSIAKSLDAKSERILTAAQSLSESAMEKSAAIEEITSTTQKIGESSAHYADSARKSHARAEFTHEASDKGATGAVGAAEAMNAVRDSGRKITTIIKLIDDIAFQTNLLSLNAAVEAARAGRNGKGFAVVADEVRSLAGRSAKAARETSAMIEEMGNRIEEATASIESLGGTLVEIKENADNLRANSDEVARLASQQSVSVNQVHISLEQISKAVNATIVISRETAMVAESIFQQAAALRKLTYEKGRDAPEPEPESEPGAGRAIDLGQYVGEGAAPDPDIPDWRTSLPTSRKEDR